MVAFSLIVDVGIRKPRTFLLGVEKSKRKILLSHFFIGHWFEWFCVSSIGTYLHR